MLTAEQNDELTQVAAGTPMGELLRRYWYPVAFTRELEEFPVRPARLLGEDFAVFKTPSGKYGILPEGCPHRRASLAYGVVEADGLRCPYHGWLFGTDGSCLDQPAEREETNFRDRVRAAAGVAAGDGRAGLGLHRAVACAGAAAVRRVRDGRGPGHRLDRPAVQLRADHGERRRPAPHRVAARPVLRVHGQASGLRRACRPSARSTSRWASTRSSGASSSAGWSRARPRRTTTGRSATRWCSPTTCGSAGPTSSRCRSGCRSTGPPPGSCSTPCTRRLAWSTPIAAAGA